MEINIKLSVFMLLVLLISCSTKNINQSFIAEVYVEDFQSDSMEECRPSDVDLNNRDVKVFFIKAQEVNHKVIHDHYNYAPCYIEGTLKYKDEICEWQIRAGATGYIKCGGIVQYYVCETCSDLFPKN